MGLISQETINKVLDRCDIVETISAYVPLKRSGRNFKALSPFTSEKTPSFFVNPDKQIFHCFSSGNGGNVISFIMKHERMEFPEAVRFLAEKAGIPIEETQGVDPKVRDLKRDIFRTNELAANFFHNELMTQKSEAANKARTYLKQRGISAEIVKQFKIGLAPDEWDGLLKHFKKHKISDQLAAQAGLAIARDRSQGFYDRFRNRIMFPIFDSKSRCIAFGARTLTDETAKYINSPETPVYVKGEHLYGFHLSKDAVGKNDSVIIVEGYMDFIMPFQAGVTNIAASLGTALTPEQIRLVRRYTQNIVMLFDTDRAGQAAMLRSLDLLIEQDMHVKVVTLEKGDDPDSFIRRYGVEKFRQRIDEAKNLFSYKLDLLRGELGVDSVEKRNKIAQEMLPTITKFESEIIKSEYIRQLAGTLFLSQDAILKEYEKVSRKSRPGESARGEVEKPAKINKQEHTAERNVLKLILEDQEFVASTREELTVEDFQDHTIKEIISKVFELYDAGSEVSPVNLMSCFNDESVQQIISGVLLGREDLHGDLKKIHKDCIGWIKTNRVKQQRQELLLRIRHAETLGNDEELEKLKNQFNELMKK